MGDRLLLVAACWRRNLTLCQLASLFGAAKAAAGCIIGQIGPLLALKSRQRCVNGTVPTPDV
ncbi:hypothetical protein ACN2WE_31135 [Streptomyces sp. cg28]|uniref:hypothetical protein n=1 Tax=Streptomyces sp. cg28 TaxID=3403457 RepID=UPI003B221186